MKTLLFAVLLFSAGLLFLGCQENATDSLLGDNLGTLSNTKIPDMGTYMSFKEAVPLEMPDGKQTWYVASGTVRYVADVNPPEALDHSQIRVALNGDVSGMYIDVLLGTVYGESVIGFPTLVEEVRFETVYALKGPDVPMWLSVQFLYAKNSLVIEGLSLSVGDVEDMKN